jgi:heat shock protein HslJ
MSNQRLSQNFDFWRDKLCLSGYPGYNRKGGPDIKSDCTAFSKAFPQTNRVLEKIHHFKKTGSLLILAGAVLLAACGSTPQFGEIRDKEWKLWMIQTGQENAVFDRNQLAAEGFGDIFTIRFADRVSGKGAPNRYFGPYETGKDRSLIIRNVAATLMAPIREPEKLKERDFFNYLENVYHWDINKGNLELFTRSQGGVETVMVFVLDSY